MPGLAVDPAPPPDPGAPDGGPPGGDGDCSNAGCDSGTDAQPAGGNPFPGDPQGGEFAWVVTVPGVSSSSSVAAAVDATGNIFVVAQQTGAVTLGSIQLPAPARTGPLVVLKLTADGTPIWGRSFDAAAQTKPRALATTSAGDLVLGAQIGFKAVGTADASVTLLDGGDGTTKWTSPWVSSWDDTINGIAAGQDSTGALAIYVFGELGDATTVAGQVLRAGGTVARYNEDGTLRWARTFPQASAGFNRSLALDPVRGPVITGHGRLALGDQVLTSGGTFVAGFDHDGVVRFTNQISVVDTSTVQDIAVAPGGDVYVASDTERDEVIIDGHPLPVPLGPVTPFVARFTAEGRFTASNVLVGSRDSLPSDLATDARGASYLMTSCAGLVEVQPEITCTSGNGSIIASYDADNTYRWATSIEEADAQALVAAPGNRMIVAGTALTPMTRFGSVQVATRPLFIAALGGGLPRPPTPLPAAPAITSALVDGASDSAIRQGGAGTLVIEGDGLDRVTSARLGDIYVHVPPGAATAGTLRLPVTIPHGHDPGLLTLTLSNAGGVAQLAGAVTVTPIVVAPGGSNGGRGTFSSPLRLCRANWFDIARYGDVMLLRNGVHACSQQIDLLDGVTVRGESKGGTIVTGDAGRQFLGFGTIVQGLGPIAIENLTIQSASFAAITLFDLGDGAGSVRVTDVDMQGLSASGIYVETGGTAIVTRFRYLQSQGAALAVAGGRIDAHQVEASGAFRGALVIDGALIVDDSELSSTQPALQAGDPDDLIGTRTVTVTRTTLRSTQPAIVAFAADLTVSGSMLEPLAPTAASDAIELQGGSLTMSDSTVHAWPGHAIVTSAVSGNVAAASLGGRALDDLHDAVSLTLDHVTISACGAGIDYDAGVLDGRLSLHGTVIQSQSDAVVVRGAFVAADLGTAEAPGDNQLATTSGPALSDVRSAVGAAIDARGTPLNGVTYSGDVLGPADAATGYHIEAANTVHF